MPYIRISDNMEKDAALEAETAGITVGQAIERRWYGYDQQQALLEDAKKTLLRYTASEQSRYNQIAAWVANTTEKMCGQKLVVEYDKIFLGGSDVPLV
jgi:hypothetical protein